jgi:mannose-1-phosphate guanylyltransferase
MAGGQGQRFWPLSTVDRPKQFLDLERAGRTMIQATFDRLLPLAGTPDDVFVATASRYVALVQEQLPDVPAENVIVEPIGRDSAPAIALASLTIHARRGDATVGFFSSDHRIEDVPAFHAAVRHAITLAEGNLGLVTLGITPTRPATAYGYIEMGQRVGVGFRVRRFVEKPDAVHVRGFVESGALGWNAGIFVWRNATILNELERHAPDIVVPLRRALADGELATVFPTLPSRSIDYAVMEHTERAYVVPVECGWDDVGDWVALERLLQAGGPVTNANTVVGSHVGFEASGNIVYTWTSEDVVVTVGVHDLVVVKKGNTVLLVAKDRLDALKSVLRDEALAMA